MKLAFIVPSTVELLDLSGPVQVFVEAQFHGFKADIEFYSYLSDPMSTAGIGFANVRGYREAELNEGDFLFVPGMSNDYVIGEEFKEERVFFRWLRENADRKVNVCSICNGAFALGEAGLLDYRECTTHWRRVESLQQRFPKAKVLTDVMYAKSDNIYSSAGISAGIDLALGILEEMKDPRFVHKVARGLVVYHRRQQSHSQQSVYLDYRNHINPKIHEVQDYMVENLAAENSIETLASMVAMSPRNLSRVFKEETGSTIVEYLTRLRQEHARTLLNNPSYTMEYIAAQCGYKTARQLQRILK
ncbi:MAG: helix-turn-helix domain-containing protein [Cyclobacteriaceae bacterium]|nr:helix-turn-helix domain-containing protein [Cyclobacteriaceae bacterium]